jgi:hypothetical protein
MRHPDPNPSEAQLFGMTGLVFGAGAGCRYPVRGHQLREMGMGGVSELKRDLRVKIGA